MSMRFDRDQLGRPLQPNLTLRVRPLCDLCATSRKIERLQAPRRLSIGSELRNNVVKSSGAHNHHHTLPSSIYPERSLCDLCATSVRLHENRRFRTSQRLSIGSELTNNVVKSSGTHNNRHANLTRSIPKKVCVTSVWSHEIRKISDSKTVIDWFQAKK